MDPASLTRAGKVKNPARSVKAVRLLIALTLIFLQLPPDALAQSRFSSRKKPNPHSVDEKRLISRDEAIRQMNLKLEDQGPGLTESEQRLIQRLRDKPRSEEPLDAGKKTGEHAATVTAPDPALAPEQPYAELSGLSSSNIEPDEGLLQTQVLPASDIQDITSAVSTNSVPSLIRSNDPYYDYLWWHQAVHAREAWEFGTGEGVVVAVVDTGVDILHEDLTRNIWTNSKEINGNGIDDDGNGYTDDYYGWNFSNLNNDVIDDNGHGTHVAGIIAAAADNQTGITGIAPNSKILPVKVANAKGEASLDQILYGIKYAADMGANVINVSMGGLLKDKHGLIFDGFQGPNPHYDSQGRMTNQAEIDQYFEDLRTKVSETIYYAQNKGSVIIFAAGNDSLSVNSNIFAAGGLNGAGAFGIMVGAMDEGYGPASFSNKAWVQWDPNHETRYNSSGQSYTVELPYLQGTIDWRETGQSYQYNESGRFQGGSDPAFVGLAPGKDILSLRAGGTAFGTALSADSDYAFASGTSMAAPIVAGMAALLLGSKYIGGERVGDYGKDEWGRWSGEVVHDPNLNTITDTLYSEFLGCEEIGGYDQCNSSGDISTSYVRRLLSQSAVDLDIPGYDHKTGYGLFDVHAAMSKRYDQYGNLIAEAFTEPDASGAVAYQYVAPYEYEPYSDIPKYWGGVPLPVGMKMLPSKVKYADGRSVRYLYEPIFQDHPDGYQVIVGTRLIGMDEFREYPGGSYFYNSKKVRYDTFGDVISYEIYKPHSAAINQYSSLVEKFEGSTTTYYEYKGRLQRIRTVERSDDREIDTAYQDGKPVLRTTRRRDNPAEVISEETFYPGGSVEVCKYPEYGGRIEYYLSGKVRFKSEGYWDTGTFYFEDGMAKYDPVADDDHYYKVDPDKGVIVSQHYKDGSYKLFTAYQTQYYTYEGKIATGWAYHDQPAEVYDAQTGIVQRFDGLGRVIYRKDTRSNVWFSASVNSFDGSTTITRSDGSMEVWSEAFSSIYTPAEGPFGNLMYSKSSDGSWVQMAGPFVIGSRYDAKTKETRLYYYSSPYSTPGYVPMPGDSSFGPLESIVVMIGARIVRTETFRQAEPVLSQSETPAFVETPVGGHHPLDLSYVQQDLSVLVDPPDLLIPQPYEPALLDPGYAGA